MTESRAAEEAEIVRIKAEHQIAKMDHERDMALFDEKSIGRMPLALRLMFDDRLRDRVHRAADEMSRAVGFTPPHLIGKTEACLVVVTRAVTWNLDPYSVAMTTYQTPGGKVGYEGALVRAILEASGELRGMIRHEWYGDWSKLPRPSFKMVRGESGKLAAAPAWEYWSNVELGLGVRISATLASTGEEMSLDFDLMDAHPRNATTWPTRPKLQLLNPAIRAFAKQVRPSLLMGVHFADDQSDAADMRDVTPTPAPAVTYGERKASPLAPQIGPRIPEASPKDLERVAREEFPREGEQSRQEAAETLPWDEPVASSPKLVEPATEDAAGFERLRRAAASTAALAEDAGAIARRVVGGEDDGDRLLADAAGLAQTPPKPRGRPKGSKNKPRDDVREADEKAAADLKDRAMAPDVDEMALDLIYRDEAFKRLEIRAKDLADEVTVCVEQSRRELFPDLGEPDFSEVGEEAEETQQTASGKVYALLDVNGKVGGEFQAAEWLETVARITAGSSSAMFRNALLRNNRGILEDLACDHPELEEQWSPLLAEARR